MGLLRETERNRFRERELLSGVGYEDRQAKSSEVRGLPANGFAK
jgi:hypothetical protein